MILPTLPFDQYERVICIPTYEEFEFIKEVLQDILSLPYKTLLLLNNNCRTDSSDTVKKDNARLHNWLLTFPNHSDSNCHLIDWNSLHVLLLDHSHAATWYRPHEGVGLARDQLGQLAGLLIDASIVTCPWIWCTDGDVRLPTNYLDLPTIKTGVELTGYIHTPAPLELILYEIGLRYYTLGLQWVGSPIAFPTIGSCIAIHAQTFKSIYGFPNRQAAEDFYLLNKSVKVGPVQYSNSKTITIRGRPSERVPFGTGQGMKLIVDQNLRYDLYHPHIFIVLKDWIAVLNTASDEQLVEQLSTVVPDYPYFSKIQKVIKQPCPLAQRIRRRFVFFDCFQTMRWIHHMRDTRYPSIPIQDALYEAPFIYIKDKPNPPTYEKTNEWEQLQHHVYIQEMNVRGRTYKL